MHHDPWHDAFHLCDCVLWVAQDKKPIERNLQEQARQAQWLVLWLDCDREGENIAFEVCLGMYTAGKDAAHASPGGMRVGFSGRSKAAHAPCRQEDQHA